MIMTHISFEYLLLPLLISPLYIMLLWDQSSWKIQPSVLSVSTHGTRAIPEVLRTPYSSCCEMFCSPARCPLSASDLLVIFSPGSPSHHHGSRAGLSSARLCGVWGQRWGGGMAGSMSWGEAAFDGISHQFIQTGCGKVILLLCFIHRSQLQSAVSQLLSKCTVRQKLWAWSGEVGL